MQEVREKFSEELKERFDGKTIGGAGAHFGEALPLQLRSKIAVYFDQSEVLEYPAIIVNPISVSALSRTLSPNSGLERLDIDVIIRADTKRQGWAIVGVLEKAVEVWLRDVDHHLTPTGYTFDVTVGQPRIDIVPEGDLIAHHLIVPIFYLRPQEVTV